MSVAPHATPSMSTRRGSIREEEEIAVEPVVVRLNAKTEDQRAAAYRSTSGDNGQDDLKSISTSFMAVLAPNCDTAMASLQSQPPGTYLLVKEEDAAIAVYVKFRQAVRALTLVKGKEVNKNGDAIQLAKLRKKDLDVLMQTTVHNMRLSSEAYFFVEHCWKRFLPQVQAVVFELCCEPHLDEETKLEDWTSSMIPSSAYSLGLMPEACGFYILAAPGSGADASISSVLQVRQVEFDFNKFAITVADGTLKPSALLLATSFSSKRTFEAGFTFNAIRDNFLSPDQVILKETSLNSHLSPQSSLLNCVDLSSNDRELGVLTAVESICGKIMPYEPLPDSFLAVLHEMHLHFGNAVHRSRTEPKPAQWSAQKMKVVGRIIPILVELLIASAAFSEPKRNDDHMDAYAVAAENKKKQIVAQFTHSMRFDILFMAARSDDSVICRLTHQICQLLGARIRLPAELVDFIRDLAALFPIFLRLFLRNQGIVALWRNLHHNDHDKEDTSSDSGESKAYRTFRTLTTSTTVVNALRGKGERTQSLFGLARKPVTKARKSLSLGTRLITVSFLSSEALAFFRLSPLSVQIYLGTQLRDGYFTFPDIWKEDSALVNIAFCCCIGRKFCEPVSNNHQVSSTSICARSKNFRSSAKMVTFELLLQLSLRFLYHKTSFGNWDRDVALLLRLQDVHQNLCTEIIDLVRRQTEAQDVNTKDALFCELGVAIACVSTLFRLERKRRQEMSSAVGEKKYLSFIYSFRTKLRALNERLKGEANYDRTQTEEADVAQTDDIEHRFLLALAEVFKWIPRPFLDEWIVLYLRELLQAVNGLSNAIKEASLPLLKQLQYVRDIHEICQVFAVMLKRASDPEIQTILIRALGTDSYAIISLLRFVLLPHSLSMNGGRDAVYIQLHVLNFLSAFINLDIALPVQIEWESKNRKPREEGSMDEDAEIIEQLKGELLIRVLGPRMTIDDGDQSDQTLWEYVQELMFPNIASINATSRMISSAVTFRSVPTPPILLTAISRSHFQMEEAFLLLQQALYTAQDACSSVDYASCVASHLRRIEQYCDRIVENEGQEEFNMVYRMVELNFRCLIVLASRRSQCPAIQDAFYRARVLSSNLKRLRPQASLQHDPVSSRSHGEHAESAASEQNRTSISCLPPLNIPRLFSTANSDVLGSQSGSTKLSLSRPPSTSSEITEVNIAEHFILAEPGLHVLALVLLATFVIVDPNLEIDEKICPRISVPGHAAADSSEPSDMLWMLQQHLVAVEMDQRYFEALMVEMDTLQAFVSTQRLSAVRTLLRLLCPNHIDCNLYTTQEGDRQSREYIAKGAFSTVYRQHSALPRPEVVAIKVVEHQRRAGELCALSGLFNEVSILSKLRGDLAATQLVDFGNHHTAQSFEIIMEYCPCSLTEWRSTIKRSEVPFRSCLVMILRTFEKACQCLIRIHKASICHFDIKSDNILVRSSARELSRRLLEKDDAPTSEFKGWICFADFGESKVVDADFIPVRTFTFSSLSSGNASPVAVQKQEERFMSLSRTRGTEAIKSPEVLKIKGSEKVGVKVTLASDIWSLGCLLYELVTQELLFQNDDWASLYAHLVVTQDQPVLRSDHKEKMFAALQPTCSEEEAVVSNLFELCNKILVREPTKRPKLETIAAQVHKVLIDVYELPLTASDELFIISLQSNKPSASEVERSVSALQPFAVPSRKSAEKLGVIVPVRLFWNFFLAAEIAQTQTTRIVTSCLYNSHGPACKDVLSMDTFESKYEADFVHFVYLSWHESTSQPEELTSGGELQNLIQELHEEEHRTCFLLNPRLKSSVDLHLLEQLIQHAPHYFPVLQRRLRDEAGRVIFVVLAKDGEDTKQLQHVLIGMFFFFLRGAFDLPVFDIVRYFARDCAKFFNYPRPEFLQHLLSYSVSHIKDTATLTFVHCRCGANVLTIDSSALVEALAIQNCTCHQETQVNCQCFHPFLPTDELDFDDELFPIGAIFVHDFSEEQLVLPLETRSKRGDEVQWVSLDAVAVGRTEGSALRCKVPVSKTDSERHIISRFEKLTGRASKVAGEEAVREAGELHELLVRGLQRRGNPSDASSSDAWELYECQLCRLPLCALSEGKVAVPMLHQRR